MTHPNWLRYCPLHLATLLPYKVEGDARVTRTVRRCPVCLHIARVKVQLAIATYKQEKPWPVRKERVFA